MPGLFALPLAASCGQDTQPDATKTQEPAVEAQKLRTIESTPEKVQLGKASFGACMGCHGVDGAGTIGVGPRLASKSYLTAASDEFLVTTISKGRPGTTMVPWGETLDAPTIEAIVVYLRSLSPAPPANLDESELKGNAENGAKLFRDICSGCHGRSGAGYQETANGTGIGRKAFLDAASDGFIRHIVHHGKSLTKMRGFAKGNVTAIANLKDGEVDDVIAHLRQNAW